MNNFATIFTELGNRIDSEKLGALAPAFERSVAQRLGHLLSRSGHEDRTEPLFRRLSPGLSIPWIELDPMASGDPDLSPALTERDERWHVIVRRSPESDV